MQKTAAFAQDVVGIALPDEGAQERQRAREVVEKHGRAKS